MSERVVGRVLAICRGALVTLLATVGAGVAIAAETSVRAPMLTGNSGPIETPGIGKILLAFVLTLGVGVALILLLRRVLPWFPRLVGQETLGGSLRVLSSRNVHVGLKLHVIEVEGATVLVAEGKSGVAMLPLPPRASASPPGSDSTNQ